MAAADGELKKQSPAWKEAGSCSRDAMIALNWFMRSRIGKDAVARTIANPATVSNDMKVYFSTGQFRTCPICRSETEEIDQGTFDGTAFRCKTHGEVEVTYDALYENRVASPDQWEHAFQVAGPEPPPLQVAVPAFSPMTLLKNNSTWRRANGLRRRRRERLTGFVHDATLGKLGRYLPQ